jgi:hypothetical protein
MSVAQFVELEFARETEMLGENTPSANSFIESYKLTLVISVFYIRPMCQCFIG